jgi:hypothetical protein
LEVELVGGAVIRLDVEELQRVELPVRLAADEGGIRIEASADGDRLYRRRGTGIDRVDGLVQALESEGVRFESSLGERLFPWSELAALFVQPLGDPSREQAPAGDGTPVIVDLHGGTRLMGELRGLDAGLLRLDRARGETLALPTALMLGIAVVHPDYGFLSELEPSDLGPMSPFQILETNEDGVRDAAADELGMVWPPRFDRAQSGRALRAGGREHARGIGVHAPSRLTWKLDGEWSELRTSAALDDEIAGNEGGGTVVFVIVVDGEERFRSPLMTHADGPLPIPPIALVGARELVLEVEIGDDSFALDRADWLRPVLVRKP